MPRFILGVVLVLVGIALLVSRGVTVQTKAGPLTKTPPKAVGLVALALGALLALSSFTRIVGATDVGIPVTLGKIGSPLNPGVHFTLPWTNVTSFSTRLLESNMSQVATEGDRTTADGVEVLSSEGGRLVLDITVRYRIDPQQASALFRVVGGVDGIRERIVRPDTRSLVRDVYSRYTAEEGYSLKREIVAGTAEKELNARLKPRGIVLDALKVRDIKLEANLQAQITAKLEAKQAAERALIEQRKAQTEAETRKKVALTDAEAKVVRARGEAEANQIITASLTSELLRAKEIEAIASNPNTVLYPYGQPVNPFVATNGARSPAAAPTTTVPAPAPTDTVAK